MKASSGNLRSGGGFTMMEILMVVAVVLILGGLLVPVMGKVRRGADRATCLGKLREIGTALELYMNDHGDRFPDLVLARLDADDEEETLEVVLAPYLQNEEAFHCPADRELFSKSGSSYLWNTTQNGLHKTNTSFLGQEGRPEVVPLVLDKEAFHGETNGSNILYADYRTTNKLTFDVGSQ